MITARLRYDEKFTRITTRLENTLHEAGEATTRNMAENIVKYIRSKWQHKQPSTPFKPPATRSGVLNDGISVEKQGRVSGKFGSKNEAVHFIVFDTSDNNRGQYALAVEDGNKITNALPRPFLEPAMEKHADDYKDLMNSEWRRRR